MTAAAAILSTSCTGRDTQLYMFSLQAQQGIAAAPLVAAAAFEQRTYTCAADVIYTLRFDAKTGNIKLFVDPLTNVQSAYCPQVCTTCTCVLYSMQSEGT